ncbi:MAG: RNase P modulator RnpM [Chloroflexia bacterium]
MKKDKPRPRHIPERTCVACRRREAKRGLIRVVRTPEGQVEVDPTGRKPGRGAYLCPHPACWEEALKRRALNRALRVVLTSEEVERLRQYARSLPVEEEVGAAGRGQEDRPG